MNNIDWDALTPDSAAYATALYYKELIAVRRSAEFLKNATPSAVILDKNEIEILYEADDKVVGCLVLNPNDEAMTFTLPEGRCDFLMGSCGSADGTCEVPAKSAVLIKVTQ